MKINTNPEYIGPGYWSSWHIRSYKSNNKHKKSETSRSIAIDIESFPCLKCREHAIMYVKLNPLLNAINSEVP